jgi:hypothetical protein
MAGTYDAQLRHTSVSGSKEIKASANFGYITNGITLKGSAFATGATVLEGQCLVKENASGKYVPYNTGGVVDNAGALPAGYSNPVILDQSIKFELTDAGANPDVICGQVLVWGAVWEGQLIGVTAAFKDTCKMISFVTA